MAKGTVLRYRKPVQYYDIQAGQIKPAGWVVRLANVIFQFLPSQGKSGKVQTASSAGLVHFRLTWFHRVTLPN